MVMVDARVDGRGGGDGGRSEDERKKSAIGVITFSWRISTVEIIVLIAYDK
jgi:hypothetical protein